MKKFFSFVAVVLFASSMMAEGLLFEQTYPGQPSEFTSAYTKSFTLTTGDYTLTYANVNNGKQSDNWDAIRAGRKSDPSVATITSEAIAEQVSKIVVYFTQVDASKTNSLSLLVADNAALTGATEIPATIAVGEVAFEIAAPAANKFYQIKMDMAAHGNSNGFNRWDKVQFIVAEGGTPIVPTVYDTLSVAEALAIAETLDEGASSSERYYVEGYAVNVAEYSAEYKNQDFYLVDDASAPDSLLQAFRAVPQKDGQAYPVLAGDKVRAFGKIKNFQGRFELDVPQIEFLEEVEGDRTIPGGDEPPVLPEGVLSCAQAVAAAANLADPTADNKTIKGEAVVVRGYVTFAYDAADGKQSVWVDDKKGGNGLLQGAYLQVTEAVAVGDYVELNGTLAKYYRASKNDVVIEVIDGTMAKVGGQGIENVTLTEKVQKVMIDGVMYIVRDNKMFNLQGAQVR